MASYYQRGRRSSHLLAIFCFIWIVNFAAFVIISGFIGGDAFSGHVLDGHYYLKSHGKLTEVSRWVFIYSLCHAGFTIASFVLYFAVAIFWRLFILKKRSPQGMN